jgi:general secretion pathway protein A
MYEDFYRLDENPFSILPDPSFLYMSRRHSMAYAMLVYGVAHGAGFTVVTGDVGCGKTTLIRHLLNNIEQDVNVGVISNTQQELGELLKWVLMAFDQPYATNDKATLFDQFQKYLIKQYSKGARTVLIIDEAQNLSGVTLEEVRMLSNINVDKDQLLQLVLVGQPQLKELLRHRDLEQFAQRVSADFHIGALEPDEVADYIRHRLKAAGRESTLFDDVALQYIARVTRGVPRVINTLCDTALVYGFAVEAPMIGKEVIESVLKDKARNGIFGPEPAGLDKPGAGKGQVNRPRKKANFGCDEATARLLFPSLSKKK